VRVDDGQEVGEERLLPLSCERYPDCKGTRDLSANGAPAQVRETDILCDKCGKPMVIKTGRFGEFLSCTGYPTCKNARPVPLGVACPKCGGDIIEIRARKKGGRTFYGCSNYNAEQKCDFKLWQRPVKTPCPDCGATFLTRAGGKTPLYVCATKDCGYKRELTEEELDGSGAAAGEGAASGSSPPSSGDEGAGESGERAPMKAAVVPKPAAKPVEKTPAKPAAKAASKPAAKKVASKSEPAPKAGAKAAKPRKTAS
jgi:DNA topoisomerase-1